MDASQQTLAQFLSTCRWTQTLSAEELARVAGEIVEKRVARSLGALFNPVLYPGIGRQILISQEEIGFLAGVSRQRVNQALQVLEKAGLLRVDYGGVTVIDLQGLQRFGA